LSQVWYVENPARPFVVTGEIFFSVVPPERATPPLKRVSNVAGEQAEMHIGIFLLCNGYQRSDQSLVKMQVSTAAGKQASRNTQLERLGRLILLCYGNG